MHWLMVALAVRGELGRVVEACEWAERNVKEFGASDETERGDRPAVINAMRSVSSDQPADASARPSKVRAASGVRSKQWPKSP